MLPHLKCLGCQIGITRRLIMQKARRHPINRLRPLVSVWFQGLFTPLFRVLFTFPLQYWFTIGLLVVFRLTRWCWWIQTGFLRPRPTQDTPMYIKHSAYRTVTLFGSAFQRFLLCFISQCWSPTTPVCTHTGLASSAFARHYLRNHYLFSFPPPT